jgi:hypothetical protein
MYYNESILMPIFTLSGGWNQDKDCSYSEESECIFVEVCARHRNFGKMDA